jgi:hypothetical protein
MAALTPTAEAAIRGICAEHASFKLVAVQDVIDNYRADFVKLGDLSAYLDRVEQDGTKLHWFTPKAGSPEALDAALERDAFELGRPGSQSAYLVKYGEAAAKAAAEKYQNPFARGIIGKPGTPLAGADDVKGHDTNPWHPRGIDPATGRWTKAAQDKQGLCIKNLGTKTAAGIARAVGYSITGAPLRK